jgi:rhodanese-related sulfurtransferase
VKPVEFTIPMRKSIAVALLLTLTTLAPLVDGQMKKQTPAPGAKSPLAVSGAQRSQAGDFPRISQSEAFKLYNQGKAVFVDVRSNSQFALGHIKGAVSIPGSQMVARFKEVAGPKTVITYCACSAEQSSGHAATSLVNHGVKNVWALKGGWNDWKSNGYPTATGPK